MRTLKPTQTAEAQDVLLGSEWSEVLRVASELYAKDRLEIERASHSQELKQAAAEVGLPPEYLERAAMALEAERSATARRRLTKWRRLRVASALAITLTVGWLSIRRLAPAPVIVAPAPAQWFSVSTPVPPPAPPMPPIAALQSPKGFPGKNLRGANLAGENLAGKDLSMQCLRGAVLTDANLRGAQLNGADLRGADLAGADLAGAELDGAIYDGSTRWPKGFDPVSHYLRRMRG